ncbi:MAG: hypothetical protein KGJ07_00535 [Patescibacteria group bacterium]|nr:hypothetical protein [Patescibacteria group bacterium]
MIEIISFAIAIMLNATGNGNINQTSIAFNQWGQSIQTILVYGTFGSVLIGIIIIIEKIDKGTLLTKKIVLVGIRGKCCNPRNVIVLENYYQCKKCKRLFERKSE